MAIPAYTEDLTDIDLAESGSTGVAVNVSGGGGAAPAFGADLGMQGNGCWDRQVSTHERGIAFNQTPGTGTVAAGIHIFTWGFVATPGIVDVLATRGAYVLIGTSATDLVQFHVEGSDTYGAQGRVGKCYVVDYVNTSNTGSIPYRTLYGTPGATPTYFGFGIKTTAAAKGSNLGADAIRYGTGAYLTAGELISAGDASDDPCTFAGFNTQNDAIANRWGILTSTGGANYEQQGRFVIGQNNAGTATLCRFKDSDKNINFVDTVHSETSFTQIIIDHASTRAELTNINLTGLGTNNPGQFNVNANDPTVIILNGTWTDIGVTTLQSNTTATGLTWRSTDQITQNGATIDTCLIDLNTASAAILSDAISSISDTNFISDGTGHAVEYAPTGAGPFSVNWDGNTDSGYAATDGSTGNETILINPVTGSADITLTLTNGAGVPTIMEDAGYSGTFTLVTDVVTLTVQVNDDSASSVAVEGARVRIEEASGGALVSEGSTNASGTYADTGHVYAGDVAVVIKVRLKGYKPFRTTGTIDSNGITVGVRFVIDKIVDLP